MEIITFVIAGVLAALVSYATDKLGKDIKQKAIVVGVIAFVAGSVPYFYQKYDEANSKPQINVKLEMGTDYLSIGVMPDSKQGLKSVKLGFHLPVRVKEVRNDNQTTNGRSEVIVTGGTEVNYLTNRIDIDIYQIQPGRSMNYLILFDPAKEVSIDYLGKDLYEMSYVWSHKSTDHWESVWREISTGKKVDRPIAEIGVIRFVGNSDKGGVMCTAKVNVLPKNNEKLVEIKSVQKGFSYGVVGVDDRVQTILPRRVF